MLRCIVKGGKTRTNKFRLVVDYYDFWSKIWANHRAWHCIVIRASWRSSRLQGKGSTFSYQLFEDIKYWSRTRESNPWPPVLQSSVLQTELISPAAVKPFFSINHHLSSFQFTDPALQQSVPDDTSTLFSGMSVHAVRLFSSLFCFSNGEGKSLRRVINKYTL